MVGKSGYYSEVYREMAELIGEAAVIKLWRSYSGLTVTFPRQLYSREYIREYIRGNMGVLKPSEIARNVGMTERRDNKHEKNQYLFYGCGKSEINMYGSYVSRIQTVG